MEGWKEILLGTLQTAIWAFAIYMLGRFLAKQIEGHLGRAAERLRRVGPVEFDTSPAPPQSSEPENPIIAEQASHGHSQVAETNLTQIQLNQLQSVRTWIQSLQNDTREAQVEIALANWQLSWNFEALNFQVLGSQLNFLSQCNAAPIPDSSAKATYEAVAKWYPHIYANYSFDLWVNWLINAGLLARQNNSFAITEYGREFLRYLVGRGYNLIRPS